MGFWFPGIDPLLHASRPGGLAELDLLLRELPRLLAQRAIYEFQFHSPRTAEQVKDLVYRATENLDLAEKAEANFILSQHRASTTPTQFTQTW